MSTAVTDARAQDTLGRRVSRFFFRHPGLGIFLLLTPPLLWLGIIYLGSLFALLIQSFFSLDGFTGQVVREFTLSTYLELLRPAHMDIILRTTVMAACVTVFAIFLAFPLAYFMARYATPRWRAFLYLAVLVPLWSSYLVRIYSWKLILAKEGIANWFLTQIGLDPLLDLLLSLPVIGGPSLSFSAMGTFIVFVYIWLPFMILPIFTALERVPQTLIEASSDLGAKPIATFRHVILPLALPGVIAGSIFTFSLTMGDFIIPQTFGNSSYFIGLAVLQNQGVAGNIPMAAAFTVVPIVVMAIYLTLAKRAGAFNAL